MSQKIVKFKKAKSIDDDPIPDTPIDLIYLNTMNVKNLEEKLQKLCIENQQLKADNK